MKSFFRSFALLLSLVSACTAAQTGSNEDLIAAVESGNVQEANRLLAAGADVNSKEPYRGGTPLHKAMERLTHPTLTQQMPPAKRRALVTIVKMLLANGADVNASNYYGSTPFHYAAVAGQKDLLELLIAKGADINATDNQGVSPLYLIAKFGFAEAAELLIFHGAEVNAGTRGGYTPLTVAAMNGDLSMAKMLVGHNADVNAKDEEGASPLLWALTRLLAKWVITSSSPAALHQQESMGSAALQQLREALLQVTGQWREVAMLLIDHGADVNVEVRHNIPLSLASLMGDKDLVEALIKNGANVNGSKHAYETPLHAAIAEKHRDVAEFLIKSGADVNALNRSGRTPLHFLGTYMDDPNLVELMINHGADVNAKDKNGATPLAFAINARNNQTAEVLRLRGGK